MFKHKLLYENDFIQIYFYTYIIFNKKKFENDFFFSYSR